MPSVGAGANKDTELASQMLIVLLQAATISQEARTAIHAHTAGMAGVVGLATSTPTPAWSPADVSAQASAASAGTSAAAGCEGSTTAAVTAAAALLLQVAEDKQIKPLLAQPLGQVCHTQARRRLCMCIIMAVTHLNLGMLDIFCLGQLYRTPLNHGAGVAAASQMCRLCSRAVSLWQVHLLDDNGAEPAVATTAAQKLAACMLSPHRVPLNTQGRWRAMGAASVTACG